MIVLASSNKAVLARWSAGLPGAQAQVRLASNLVELEGTLSGRRPEIALVDLALPDLHGSEGVRQLLVLSPQTRILVLAAVPNEDEGIAALRAGARGYANLHLDPRLLERAVAALRAGEVWVGRRLVDRLLGALLDARTPRAVPTTNGSAALDQLSPREREIAGLVGRGASNKVIAQQLGITERTVKAHLSTAFEKLGVGDRLQLALLVNGQMAGNNTAGSVH